MYASFRPATTADEPALRGVLVAPALGRAFEVAAELCRASRVP